MKNTNSNFIGVLSVAFAASAFAFTSAFAAAQASRELPDAPKATAAAAAAATNPIAVLDTSMGRITCQLFPKQAPHAVANFIGLAEGTKDWTDPRTGQKQHGKSLYNGTQFHRVIPGFMIQGGDPTATGTGGPGYAFRDELDSSLNFDRPGRLAMANSGPNTNGSQFFITHVPTPWLDGKHAIFGAVESAKDQEVVNAIKQGDKITGVEIIDSPETLFASQSAQIAAWNKVLAK